MAFSGSIHANAKMTCVSCHGGDPSDPQTSAMASSKGFRGKPSRKNVPQFCASCHADRAQMHQYGLNTHQFEDYQNSVHGKAWKRGDTNAAVCTDCHSQHAILPESDTNSSIFPKNVANTCARCHGDEKLMSKYGLKTAVISEYKDSVHAQVLASGGRQSAPSCATCHGSHTALPPGAKDIPNICNRCHTQVMDEVDQSPHARKFASGGMSCGSCHPLHNIQHTNDQMLLDTCTRCHEQGSTQAKRGADLHAMFTQARQGHQQAHDMADAMERKGFYINDLYNNLEEANTKLVEATRDQHTLNLQKVKNTLVIPNAIFDEAKKTHERFLDETRTKKLLVIPLWLLVGLMVLLVTVKKIRYEKDRIAEEQQLSRKE
ncbi:MAG: hypothetical protein ACYC7E_11795 [Armatimonadota bacterium]